MTNERQGLKTWLDLFLCGNNISIIDSSLDPAEWDLWFALLCRWRNYARHELEEWYPITKTLTQKGDHSHLSSEYIERIEGTSHEEYWAILEKLISGKLT